MDNICFEWLKSAKDDLFVIEKISNEALLTNVIAFHSQQAAEKSLKALLEFHKKDVPKIHSLNRLFKLTENYLKPDNQEVVNILDSLYIESRYPGALGLLPDGKPSLEEAGGFYKFAKDIYNKVSLLINKQ